MDTTSSLIVGPDGNPLSVPTVVLDHTDAALLRQYKKLLLKLGLREALYCNDCWNQQVHDGLEAHVTDSQIVFRCRCKLRFYQGQSF